MNIRQLFKQKAERLELQEKGYIDKTVHQMSLVSKEQKQELKRKILVFLKCNPSKSQILFNEIAGKVNDLQMQMLSDYQKNCKDCHLALKNNKCYNCDI